MNKDAKISILIPTLNAGPAWQSLLDSIQTQSIKVDRKIIVDSGSTDNTTIAAQKNGFDVVKINKTDFNHGKTRQQLVDLSNDTDICIFLTQDAILASPNSIANIVKAFDDPAVGMAYGRQLPHQNAQVLEAHARSYNYPDNSNITTVHDIAKIGFKATFCSNSFSAYRRSALSKVGGFSTNSIMGEDAIVAAQMLLAGYKKVYVSDATVYHSHSYSFAEEYRRYFDTRVFHEQNRWILEKFGQPTGEGFKFIKSELGYVLKHNWLLLPKVILSTGAKWLGYNSGRFYRKMPVSVVKKMSMHSFYWKK